MIIPSVTTGKQSISTSFITSKIIIAEKYLLKRLIKKMPYYNVYEGIDIKDTKFVHIYMKPNNIEFSFTKRVKEQLRNKLSPPQVWSGTQKIEKTLYSIEVHQNFGPSLKAMFSYVKDPISQNDFLLLMYQLIRLIQKYGSIGYVYRQLSMDQIIFDVNPQKNDLFLLNIFPLRKKGEESPILNTKYCSRGAHLGLQANIKDDLESMCYILLKIYNGTFLENIDPEDYQEAKTNLNLTSYERPLPQQFIDFYNYVVGLNYTDQVNYFQWKNLFYKAVGKESLLKPFEWMIIKENKRESFDEFSDDKSDGNKQNINKNSQIEDELKPEDLQQLNRMTSKVMINPQNYRN